MNRRHPFAALATTFAFGAWPVHALAHDAGTRSTTAAFIVAVTMVAVLLLYAAGVRALWRAAGTGRGVPRGKVAAFVAGWVVLAAALFGPVDELGSELFTAHMVQHELMMLVAAPLLVLGTPLAIASWGLPRDAMPAVQRLTRAIGGSRAWKGITGAFGAWLLHAIVLWGWHMPVAFEAALRNAWIHDLQHATFLASALLFWWALFARSGRRADGVAVLYLFTTMVHTGALGALLTFSPTLWYGTYTGGLGLSALEDQQLGGLVMWVPGGSVYLAAGVRMLARWLGLDSASEGPAGGDTGTMYAADR